MANDSTFITRMTRCLGNKYPVPIMQELSVPRIPNEPPAATVTRLQKATEERAKKFTNRYGKERGTFQCSYFNQNPAVFTVVVGERPYSVRGNQFNLILQDSVDLTRADKTVETLVAPLGGHILDSTGRRYLIEILTDDKANLQKAMATARKNTAIVKTVAYPIQPDSLPQR